MTTQYTTILKLALPVQGELSGTWGDVVNDNITEMVEQAIAGKATIDSWTANAHTLTTADGTTSESRCAILELTDTGTALTGAGTVTCPTNTKLYIVDNNTAQIITVKTSGGTGVAVPVGKTMLVYCDGTNVVEGVTHANSLSLGTSTVTVDSVLDQDDMSSDSATALATQQSIKAYVDSQVGTVDTLAEILANGNTTGGTDLSVSSGDDITFADSSKAIFGAGSDLQIYHDGSHSYIKDTATGNLRIDGTDIQIRSDTGANMAAFVSGAEVQLYHNNQKKLDTTATGVDITGTLVSDGLTVDGDGTLQSNASSSVPTLTLKDTDTSISVGQSLGRLSFSSADASPDAAGERAYVRGYLIDGTNYGVDIGAMASGGSPTKRLTVSGSGDISFYDTDGTTASFVYDASAGLTINEAGADRDFRVESENNTHMLFVNAGLDQVAIGSGAITAPSGYQFFSYGAGSGARSAFVHGAGDGGIVVSGAAASSAANVIFGNNWGTDGATFSEEYRLFMDGADDSLKFNYNANASTAMELASNGFVSIGGDSPLTPLHVKYSGAGEILRLESTDAGLGVGPIIGLFRNSASPADGDELGAINFYGEDSVSNITTYAQIRAEAADVTNGTEDGFLSFRTIVGGSDTARLNLSLGESVFNQNGVDLDFRVESDGASHMLFVDAGNNRVGIGESSPDTPLHLTTSGTGVAVTIESTSGSALSGPDISIFRNSPSPADEDDLARIYFHGENDAGSKIEYVTIRASVNDVTAGTEDSSLQFYTYVGGAQADRLAIEATETAINESSRDVDFRVESDTKANAIFVNAGTDEVNFDGARTNFGGITAETSDGEINAGLIKLRNSNTTSGYFLSIDAEGTEAGQNMTHYWYDGSYRNRFSVAGNTGETTVNDSSADIDFRVESDNNSHMLFVDAGNDFVGINKSTPETELHVRSTSAGAMTTFESSSANSSGGPNIRLWRNSASPADGDGLSRLLFQGMNSAAERIDYVEIQTEIIAASDGTESGLFQLETYVDGTSRNRLRFNSTEGIINDSGRDLDFRVESDGNANALLVDAGADVTYIGKNTGALSSIGFYFAANTGNAEFTGDGSTDPLRINRLNSDGNLINFYQDTTAEGNISVSGSTVSYNGFAGRHESSGIATTTAKGTVVSTIDELDEYLSGPRQGQTRADHAKVKMSDTVGDARVYGVVDDFTDEGKVNVISVGIGSIKVTGACAGGDLLESNGDGTAKVQTDDIVRSKTIGKVTIGDSNTGVKLVSCVLYCG